jgi:hypothetical protein
MELKKFAFTMPVNLSEMRTESQNGWTDFHEIWCSEQKVKFVDISSFDWNQVTIIGTLQEYVHTLLEAYWS